MEYTIKSLAKMAHISTRTLRYYDQIDLLKPSRISNNKYRVYGNKEIDLLHVILFYKELGIELKTIKEIINSKDFDVITILEQQLKQLKDKRSDLSKLIINLEKVIDEKKGGKKLMEQEKFSGFMKKIVDDNTKQFQDELLKKYPEEEIMNKIKKCCR